MKLGYTLLYVDSVRDTLAFYEAAFGLRRRFIDDEGTYAEFDTGNTVLGLVAHSVAGSHGFSYQAVAPSDDAPGFEIGFVTDDVSAAFAAAVKAGATPVSEPATKPWGQTASYVRDMNGFLVEICSPMNP